MINTTPPGAFWKMLKHIRTDDEKARKAAYDALPELEKAKLAYADPHSILHKMVEAYRKSVSGQSERPKWWKPSDHHLLAMWAVLDLFDDAY